MAKIKPLFAMPVAAATVVVVVAAAIS